MRNHPPSWLMIQTTLGLIDKNRSNDTEQSWTSWSISNHSWRRTYHSLTEVRSRWHYSRNGVTKCTTGFIEHGWVARRKYMSLESTSMAKPTNSMNKMFLTWENNTHSLSFSRTFLTMSSWPTLGCNSMTSLTSASRMDNLSWTSCIICRWLQTWSGTWVNVMWPWRSGAAVNHAYEWNSPRTDMTRLVTSISYSAISCSVMLCCEMAGTCWGHFRRNSHHLPSVTRDLVEFWWQSCSLTLIVNIRNCS